ncbi:hypothetical protein [Flavobacterium sp.]|uniref:hypothetical protein n=1 Tax=Flavobacterium sp. TaxID=239 RepID=UPI0025D5A13E|nr:hypothetical protein [Flavobacterium sp.]
MKKVIAVIILLFLISCSSNKNGASRSLFEVLSINNDGGANIKFYEILTEPKEIKMLLGDKFLRKIIKPTDIANSSFIILNAGSTKESYNKIKIEKVIETPTQIELFIKDTQKNIDVNFADNETLHPYTIVKVNSKKPIVIK